MIRIEAKKGPQLRNARRGEGKVVGWWVGGGTHWQRQRRHRKLLLPTLSWHG